MLQDAVPSRPGEAIATDLCEYDGRNYLIVTDKYSGWPEVYDMGGSGVNTGDTTKALVQWFKSMSVPLRLTSDNGPQFKSEEFNDFCHKWGVRHDPSSPHHH